MKYLIINVFLLLSFVTEAKVEDLFKNQTKMKDPFSLRDPFQPPKFKSKIQQEQKKLADGVLDNTEKLKEEYSLEKIQIVGVLIGSNRRVVVRSGEKNYTLKEGDHFGRKGPKIKAILPGGVILVEKITNIYGEDEYIETVVPISN